jgi:DNA-binding MarR family transcriptional regulator/N-acetylglutamate synthase-like GNAT family acetyltransferase
MSADRIPRVRRFNRLVTQRIGALDDDYLGRDRPLGESRVLYEIGPAGADLRDLRRRLGLDAGYLTRLVRALERKGLIRLAPSTADQRVRRAVLTAAGRRELREMNRRSDDAAQALLDPLTEAQRTRLVAAMDEVHRLLRLAGLRIDRVDVASTDARWCLRQYFDELDRRFEGGFDPAASRAADDREMVAPLGAFLVASVDGEPVACGGVKTTAPGIGYLKRMWVADGVRGLGVGRRMLEALEVESRALGHGILRLETNRALPEALQLYRSAGFREVAAFNTDPYAHHWLEKTLG